MSQIHVLSYRAFTIRLKTVSWLSCWFLYPRYYYASQHVPQCFVLHNRQQAVLPYPRWKMPTTPQVYILNHLILTRCAPSGAYNTLGHRITVKPFVYTIEKQIMIHRQFIRSFRLYAMTAHARFTVRIRLCTAPRNDVVIHPVGMYEYVAETLLDPFTLILSVLAFAPAN